MATSPPSSRLIDSHCSWDGEWGPSWPPSQYLQCCYTHKWGCSGGWGTGLLSPGVSGSGPASGQHLGLISSVCFFMMTGPDFWRISSDVQQQLDKVDEGILIFDPHFLHHSIVVTILEPSSWCQPGMNYYLLGLLSLDCVFRHSVIPSWCLYSSSKARATAANWCPFSMVSTNDIWTGDLGLYIAIHHLFGSHLPPKTVLNHVQIMQITAVLYMNRNCILFVQQSSYLWMSCSWFLWDVPNLYTNLGICTCLLTIMNIF